jgi:hypothetical protein
MSDDSVTSQGETHDLATLNICSIILGCKKSNCKKHEYFKSGEIEDKKVNRQLPYIHLILYYKIKENGSRDACSTGEIDEK